MKLPEIDKLPRTPVNHSALDNDLDNVFDSPRAFIFPPVCEKGTGRHRCVFHSIDEDNEPRDANNNRTGSETLQDVFKNIRYSKLLGSGGFGSVYLGKIGKTKFAVKRLHVCTKNVKARNESFRAEVRIIKLSHPNVVRTLASTAETIPEEACLIMEYAGDRNLQQVINETTEPLEIARRVRFSLNIASALEYIHRNCVVHLDLKPANVIISPSDVCKVADFGCSQLVEHGTGMVSPTQRSYLTGTFPYRSPELLKGEAPSVKADVYAFGITMWQMLAREQPYTGQHQQVVIFGVVSYNLRPKLPSFISQTDDPVEVCYRDLFRQCWEAKPGARPMAVDLVDVLSTWSSHIYDEDEVEDGLIV